jgi:hypothetical protein
MRMALTAVLPWPVLVLSCIQWCISPQLRRLRQILPWMLYKKFVLHHKLDKGEEYPLFGWQCNFISIISWRKCLSVEFARSSRQGQNMWKVLVILYCTVCEPFCVTELKIVVCGRLALGYLRNTKTVHFVSVAERIETAPKISERLK